MYGYEVVVEEDVLDALEHDLQYRLVVIVWSVLEDVHQIHQEVGAVLDVSVVDVLTHRSNPHL